MHANHDEQWSEGADQSWNEPRRMLINEGDSGIKAIA